MGISKTDAFTDNQNQLAQLAKAIGHPARVAIIDFLLQQQTCMCKDIVDELPLAQATISQHLRELKKVGLIQGSIEGNSVCYCLNVAAFKQLQNYCQSITQHLDGLNNNCC